MSDSLAASQRTSVSSLGILSEFFWYSTMRSDHLDMGWTPLQYGYPGTKVSEKTTSFASTLPASSIVLHALSMVASLSMKTGAI